jgi:hypothetical protein
MLAKEQSLRMIENGLRNFALAAQDMNMVKMGRFFYADVEIVYRKHLWSEEPCLFAFPAIFVRPDGGRTQGFVAIQPSGVIFAWREGLFRKMTLHELVPRATITDVTHGNGKANLRSASLVTVKAARETTFTLPVKNPHLGRWVKDAILTDIQRGEIVATFDDLQGNTPEADSQKDVSGQTSTEGSPDETGIDWGSSPTQPAPEADEASLGPEPWEGDKDPPVPVSTDPDRPRAAIKWNSVTPDAAVGAMSSTAQGQTGGGIPRIAVTEGLNPSEADRVVALDPIVSDKLREGVRKSLRTPSRAVLIAGLAFVVLMVAILLAVPRVQLTPSSGNGQGDEKTITAISTGGAVTIHLGRVTVTAPAGSIAKGESITVAAAGKIRLDADSVPSLTAGGFQLSTSQGQPAKPVSISLAVPPGAPTRTDNHPLLLHKSSDNSLWLPEASTVSADGKTVTAEVSHFSWIDWVETFDYAFGLLTNNRTDASIEGCGPGPEWMQPIILPTPAIDLNAAVWACPTGDRDVESLTLHVVNNRGYAQVLQISGMSADASRSTWGTTALEQTFGHAVSAGGAKAHGLKDGSTDVIFVGGGSSADISFTQPSKGKTPVTIDLIATGSHAAVAVDLMWTVIQNVAETISGPDLSDCVINAVDDSLKNASEPVVAYGVMKRCLAKITPVDWIVTMGGVLQKLNDTYIQDKYPPHLTFLATPAGDRGNSADGWPPFPGAAKQGDRGQQVRVWQDILIKAGAISDISPNHDGYYGPGMSKAVRVLQTSWGWENPSGVADAATYTQIVQPQAAVDTPPSRLQFDLPLRTARGYTVTLRFDSAKPSVALGDPGKITVGSLADASLQLENTTPGRAVWASGRYGTLALAVYAGWRLPPDLRKYARAVSKNNGTQPCGSKCQEADFVFDFATLSSGGALSHPNLQVTQGAPLALSPVNVGGLNGPKLGTATGNTLDFGQPSFPERYSSELQQLISARPDVIFVRDGYAAGLQLGGPGGDDRIISSSCSLSHDLPREIYGVIDKRGRLLKWPTSADLAGSPCHTTGAMGP